MIAVLFNGPVGKLEARYSQSEKKNAPAVLILHPNPLYGGTMNNKVVYKMYTTFVDLGFSVLRFNYRCVGKSEGTAFDNGQGELADAATALDWLQNQNPAATSFWVVGFSFGAWLAMRLLMRRPELQSLVAISPPANIYDFSFVSPCPAAMLIAQGDADTIVLEHSVADLADRLSRQKGSMVQYQVILGADHFFRNKLEELASVVKNFVQNYSNFRARKTKNDRRKKPTQDGSGGSDTQSVNSI